MSSHTEPILLVEDSPMDYAIMVRSFTRAGVANPIHHCNDGDEAMEFLFHRGRYRDPASAPRPAMILLDLNLPGTDGRKVLAQIKGNNALRSIPVIVLTTSCDKRDIDSCYRAGANSYVQKPVEVPKFIGAIQRLSDYWFQIVLMPKKDAA